MTYDEFTGQVQHRARLASTGDAVRAIHATLQTLGERLVGDEAKDLASQLPLEIGAYLRQPTVHESFTLQEFYRRVHQREQVDMPDAVYHARAVVSVLTDAVSAGELTDVFSELPEDYLPLFVWEGEERRGRAA